MNRSIPWSSLPTEIWGRILAQIDDAQRCQKIPVLSKAMHEVHKENPPPRRRWRIIRRIIYPMVEWAYQIGGTLEKLGVVTEGGHTQRTLLPQLLMAVRSCPRLRIVSLNGGISSQVLSSLGFLGRLTHLMLHNWEWDNAAEGHLEGIHHLRRLKKLQVFDLAIIEEDGEPGAQILWAALAELPLLRVVSFRTDMSNSIDEWLASIALLTQISSLKLAEPDVVGETHNISWMEEVAMLVQLTSLIINCRAKVESYQPILQLPLLEQLHIRITPTELAGLNEIELHVRSSNLREFFCDGGTGISTVKKMLPFVPTMGRLLSISMEHMQLADIPANMVAALRQLKELHLGGNNFKKLPGSFSGLVALQCLDMKNNPKLQLRAKDARTLTTLRNLTSLFLARSSQDQWDLASMKAATAITSRLPALDMKLYF